ncbi:hypothetical protein [Novosphingobium sp. JCM 18896]|uniref:hypothetical protein n=1 Tax=Novosphingobium sp. JCM 18896 TaxID=2989731 RepID=UPI002223666E|nr:hypothetical protein [Novosphingobium sp. JCM 18896]
MPGIITPANAVKPPVVVDETPPWLMEETTPVPRPRKPAVAVARARKAEPLHWGVVALTAFTAIGVLFGSHGPSQSKELLPVMIKIPVR